MEQIERGSKNVDGELVPIENVETAGPSEDLTFSDFSHDRIDDTYASGPGSSTYSYDVRVPATTNEFEELWETYNKIS